MKRSFAVPMTVAAKAGHPGWTPAGEAVEVGYKDVGELLVVNKAEINAKDNNGLTPLHTAAGEGHKEVVELLLANKAEVNAKANKTWTPLRLVLATLRLGPANGHQHQEVADLLRKHGGRE